MSQNAKKYVAPHSFISKEEDNLDVSKPNYEFVLSSEETRRASFLFLHDILNSVGGLYGFLELMLEMDDPDKIKKYTSNALVLCDSLIEEIQYHREFLMVDSGRFNLVTGETKTHDILELTALKLKSHDVSKGRAIEIVDGPVESIVTDKVLLSRILVNMTKNAVEATDEGGSVQIGSSKCGDEIRFWVHNSAVIPDEIQKQLFHTNFSTKGNDRGLGMLSIRLLGENALGGRVFFESTEEKGTYFCIDLPAKI